MATPPWKRPASKSAAGSKLTPANLAWAKAAAKKAGRRYPNLIDNMAAARRQREQEHRRDHPGLRDGL